LYREGKNLATPQARRPAFYSFEFWIQNQLKGDGKVLGYTIVVSKGFFIFKFLKGEVIYNEKK
jgi:hypothetical protein